MILSKLFNLHAAKSKGTNDYSAGKIPFVTNTTLNNGIVRYVDPFDDDLVFSGPAICISGLGHATLHFDSFLPKGNGGDSCTVLCPKKPMTNVQLIYYAALFNALHRWRFSFGRKANVRRIERLDMSPTYAAAQLEVNNALEENSKQLNRLLAKHSKQVKQHSMLA